MRVFFVEGDGEDKRPKITWRHLLITVAGHADWSQPDRFVDRLAYVG